MCISYEIITFYVMAFIDSTQLFIRSVMKDFIEYVSISISFKADEFSECVPLS